MALPAAEAVAGDPAGEPDRGRVVGALPPAWRPSTVRETREGAPARGAFVWPRSDGLRPAAQDPYDEECVHPSDPPRPADGAPSPGVAGDVWDEVVYGIDRGLGLLMDEGPEAGHDREHSAEADDEALAMDVARDWHDGDDWP